MANYDAFISYNHAQDKPVAAALQAAVQRLGKAWYRRRALRLFRDDTSLSATPHMWPAIEDALSDSRFLILIASAQSAASPWVGKEIDYWLAHKSADTLLIAVTGGEIRWRDGDFDWSPETPLPPALKRKFHAEPKWVDLRDYRVNAPARDSKFLDRAADLAATIHGIPKEDLLSQEVRQQRRALTLAWSAAASLLVLAGVAGWQWQVARAQRVKAETALNTAAATADHLVYDLAVDLRNQPGMPVALVLNILNRAEAMQQQLAAANDTTPVLQHLEATALQELSNTFVSQGAVAKAQSAAERALALQEDLARQNPSDPKYQRELAVSLNQLGDAQSASGDLASASGRFKRALAITQQLADATPDDDRLQSDLAVCVSRIFAIQAIIGQEQAALESSASEIRILQRLAAKQPDNLVWQYDLSRADNRAGILLSKMGQSARSLQMYQAGLAIREKVAAAAPDNTEYRRGLYDNYTRVGDVSARTGASQNALAAYRNALPIIEKLASSDPGNNQWQEAVASGYDKVGDMLSEAGSDDEALDNYRKSLAVRERLAANDADSVAWPREISVSYDKIADILIKSGKRDDAVASYQKALDFAQKGATAKPDDADIQSNLAFCYIKMGDVVVAGDRARARDFYQKSLMIRARLVDQDSADVQYRRDLALADERLATVATADGASDDTRVYLRKALALRQQNAASDPDNAAWQIELIPSLLRLGAAGDDPRTQYQQALVLAQKLDAAGKLSAGQKAWIGGIQQELAALPPN